MPVLRVRPPRRRNNGSGPVSRAPMPPALRFRRGGGASACFRAVTLASRGKARLAPFARFRVHNPSLTRWSASRASGSRARLRAQVLASPSFRESGRAPAQPASRRSRVFTGRPLAPASRPGYSLRTGLPRWPTLLRQGATAFFASAMTTRASRNTGTGTPLSDLSNSSRLGTSTFTTMRTFNCLPQTAAERRMLWTGGIERR